MDLLYLSQLLSFMPILFGILFFKQLDKPLRLFWIYSLLMGFTEILTEIVFRQIGMNMFLYPIYGLLHFLLISWVFYYFNELFAYKKWLLFTIPLYVLLFGSEYFFLLEPNEMPSISMLTGSVVLMLFIFIFFFELLKQSSYTPLYKQPRFLIAVSVLIYSGSTIFYFLLFNYLSKYTKINVGEIEIEMLLSVHTIFNCIFYVLNSFVFISKWKVKTSY